MSNDSYFTDSHIFNVITATEGCVKNLKKYIHPPQVVLTVSTSIAFTNFL